jgi:hypothetical protein
MATSFAGRFFEIALIAVGARAFVAPTSTAIRSISKNLPRGGKMHQLALHHAAHATHTAHTTHASRHTSSLLLWRIGDKSIGCQEHSGNTGSVL